MEIIGLSIRHVIDLPLLSLPNPSLNHTFLDKNVSSVMNQSLHPLDMNAFGMYLHTHRVGPWLASLLLIVLCTVVRWTAVRLFFTKSTIPHVPKLRGIPILGVLPLYFRYGFSGLLSRLIMIGDHGVSYTTVAGRVLVSVHDSAMIREVLALPEDLVSR